MTRNILHLLLAALIITCSFWCRLGTCTSSEKCCTSVFSAAHCCPEERPDPARCQNEQPHEKPSNKAPCDACQCICGGAVIENNDGDGTQEVDIPLYGIVDAGNSIINLICEQASRTTLPSQERNTSGRNLCVLHMSFLL